MNLKEQNSALVDEVLNLNLEISNLKARVKIELMDEGEIDLLIFNLLKHILKDHEMSDSKILLSDRGTKIIMGSFVKTSKKTNPDMSKELKRLADAFLEGLKSNFH